MFQLAASGVVHDKFAGFLKSFFQELLKSFCKKIISNTTSMRYRSKRTSKTQVYVVPGKTPPISFCELLSNDCRKMEYRPFLSVTFPQFSNSVHNIWDLRHGMIWVDLSLVLVNSIFSYYFTASIKSCSAISAITTDTLTPRLDQRLQTYALREWYLSVLRLVSKNSHHCMWYLLPAIT